MPIGNIHQFQDILSEKLWRLDTEKHANASLNNDPNAILSVDYFLYDRCCVVANGKVNILMLMRKNMESVHGETLLEKRKSEFTNHSFLTIFSIGTKFEYIKSAISIDVKSILTTPKGRRACPTKTPITI
jgi:Protein of unknown function (DUF4240)